MRWACPCKEWLDIVQVRVGRRVFWTTELPLLKVQGGDGADLCFYPEKEACVSIINSQAEIYPTADSF